MGKRILLRTNLLACAVIVVGFLVTTFYTYQEHYSSSVKYIEEVSDLTNEGIYYQIEGTLAKPVNVSLTIAHDNLLKELLTQELEYADDPTYIAKIGEYLKAYRDKYQYDSVFLVSNATNRYYNFNGLDRVLSSSDPKDAWYYSLLEVPQEFEMNVDNDKVAGARNAATLFVDCKIIDNENEKILGVVGVGLRINSIQNLLREYLDEFGVRAYFVNDTGGVEISADYSRYDNVNFFDVNEYDEETRKAILNWDRGDDALTLWIHDRDDQAQTHIVVRYLPDIDWRLVAMQDTNDAMVTLRRQVTLNLLTLAIVLVFVLVIISFVISRFRRKIISMEREYEVERQNMLDKITSQLFEEIYAFDITNNRPADNATENYFEQLGAPKGTPLDQCLRIMAEKQAKPEHRQSYIETFSPAHVLKMFQHGTRVIKRELMITNDGVNYHWVRITAQLALSELDGALHMLSFRQNIDEEKKREETMKERAQTDEMTGALRKAATQRAIDARLLAEPDAMHALFIFDIDHFKSANDQFGHAFGDDVIEKFASTIRHHFRKGDLVGRIGGDEFVAFLKIPSIEWINEKAEQLRLALDQDCVERNEIQNRWHMTASIGVALAPMNGKTFQELYINADAALYKVKQSGRNGFALSDSAS